MATVPVRPAHSSAAPGKLALAVAGVAVIAMGLAGWVGPAWGYGLFVAATLLLATGAGCFLLLVLTRTGDTSRLVRFSRLLLVSGGAAYVLAVCALAGFYVLETLQGRMEWYWVLFGPAVLAALVVFDVGLYRKLVARNLPTWQRYRQFIRREDAEPEAMRRTLIDEVILHRTLYRASRVRWLRHSLIFWGFTWMFATELFAVVLRDGFPAFGWPDVWHQPSHPLRMAFDVIFDLTGLMVLAGCLLALAWRVAVNRTPDRKYADTPTTVFLLLVVLSGFIVEGARIVAAHPNAHEAASFVGTWFAVPMKALGWRPGSPYLALWVTHVVAACAFIAYVPIKRMVHTCATPVGRLMNSQKALLAAKKRGVIGAMLLRREPSALAQAASTHSLDHGA